MTLKRRNPSDSLSASTRTSIVFCDGICASVDGMCRRTQMSSSGSRRK